MLKVHIVTYHLPKRTIENLEYPQSNSQSPSQDSKWIPLEYKSEKLPLVSLLGEGSY